MGSYEATNVVLSKIKSFDPENASKIMGYLLMNLEDSELIRLACSPDPVLHSLVLKVKTHLGFTHSPSPSSSSPSPSHSPSPSPSPSPSHLNPISRLASSSATNPFSKASSPSSSSSSPRPPPPPSNGFDLTLSRNPSSPSSHAWPLSAFQNHPISPKSTPLISYDGIRAAPASASSLSPRVNGDSDFVDERQVNEYFPFLNESHNKEDLVDPRREFGLGPHNWNNGDANLHRRSFSASDACFGCEEAASGIGYRPCLYFAKGFCKNGSNCKFAHSYLGDSVDAASAGAIVGSPSQIEGLEQREEFLRLKAAQHYQRLLAAGASPISYEKYIEFLMQQQQNDPQRAAAAAAFMMSEEFYNLSRGRPERNDFLAMFSGDKPNSSSRQIYLTFPAESTFKDEDVSEYFSKFGPVQDVRIPYQQKRMFGFVTFVYPETVRLILSKGNPHFICDSRVLVKPYKEKGKIPDKRMLYQLQHPERGDFSPCLSPSGFDSKESYDFHHGPRMFYYNPHDILLRRKLEEHAELQQAIELQERRLKNLQLPDFKNIPIHHQRSLSVGAPMVFPHQLYGHVNNADLPSDAIKGNNITGYTSGFTSTNPLGTVSEQQQPQKEVDPACIGDAKSESIKDNENAEVADLSNSLEKALPDNLFASPTKAAADHLADFSTSAEVNKGAAFSASSSSLTKFESTAASSDVASC